MLHHRVRTFALTLILSLTTLALTPRAHAVDIIFDYTYDTNNFFDPNLHPERREALEHAASYFVRFRDNLTGINPSQEINLREVYLADPDNYTGPFDVYSTNFFHPGMTVTNEQGFEIPTHGVGITVPENSVVIYAGAKPIGGSTLGRGGPGGTFNFIDIPFEDELKIRNQGNALADISGTTATDFAPWGGALTFDTHLSDGSPREWYFGKTGTPPVDQKDFISVAIHEIGHLLGFGTADAFENLVTDGAFTGQHSMELNNDSPVPLYIDDKHWAADTTSPINQPDAPETVMDPTLNSLNGISDVKRMTELDYAAFNDLGWEVADFGDATLDGIVNLEDLAKLATFFGMSDKTWKQGDFTFDGTVNLEDLAKLATNFGLDQTQLPQDITSPQSIAIPEPTSLLTLLLLTTTTLTRRRSTSNTNITDQHEPRP